MEESKIILVNAESIVTKKYNNYHDFFSFFPIRDANYYYKNTNLNILHTYIDQIYCNIKNEKSISKIKDIYAVNSYIIKYNDLLEKIINDFENQNFNINFGIKSIKNITEIFEENEMLFDTSYKPFYFISKMENNCMWFFIHII